MTKKILHATSDCGDRRGLVVRPGLQLVAILKRLGIEYHATEVDDVKDFYIVVSSEEELVLKLAYSPVEWIPYGAFVFGTK